MSYDHGELHDVIENYWIRMCDDTSVFQKKIIHLNKCWNENENLLLQTKNKQKLFFYE